MYTILFIVECSKNIESLIIAVDFQSIQATSYEEFQKTYNLISRRLIVLKTKYKVVDLTKNGS